MKFSNIVTNPAKDTPAIATYRIILSPVLGLFVSFFVCSVLFSVSSAGVTVSSAVFSDSPGVIGFYCELPDGVIVNSGYILHVVENSLIFFSSSQSDTL